MWRRFGTICVALSVVASPSTAAADVMVQNSMAAEVPAATNDGPRFFDYTAGATTEWDSSGDFSTGTLSDVEVVAPGSVQLSPGSPPFEVCVNAGGANFTTAGGTLYVADQYSVGGVGYLWNAGVAIANTVDDHMYRSIRYTFQPGGVGPYSYQVPVPAAGAYEVEVGMLESFNLPPNQNQTDLTIEGVQVLNDFSPYAATGGRWRAIDQTFNTTVTDGVVDIDVAHIGWYGAIANFCVRSVGAAAGSLNGTWTSSAVDTLASGTNVFGALFASADTPAGTSVSFQVGAGATAGAATAGPFTGPDGTSATTYQSDDPLFYGHDGVDRFVAVRATLTTTTSGVTPVLHRLAVTSDLPEMSGLNSGLTVTGSFIGQTMPLVRVLTSDLVMSGSQANLRLISTAGAVGALKVGTDHPSSQIVIAGGTASQASGPQFAFGPGESHSVVMTEQSMSGSVTAFTWVASVGTTGVLVEHDFAVTIS